MLADPYRNLAGRYDRMRAEDPHRAEFFGRLFAQAGVRSVLDCACGTGRDLILFRQLGLDVVGSDLSAAMLAEARVNLARANLDPVLHQADFRELAAVFDPSFGAVVCLGNSINELLDDRDVVRALRSMRSVLRDEGVLVLDQGQTEASIQVSAHFADVVEEPGFTRTFVMSYEQTIMTVRILDFLVTGDGARVEESTVRLRIRLKTDWQQLLREAGYKQPSFFGDWRGNVYDNRSQRLILVAPK